MKNWIKGIICVTVIGCVASADAVFPLRVDIDVNANTSRRQIGSGDDGSAMMETVQVKVKVRKSGGDLPEGKLSGELYVIGKQIHTGHYGIIDVQKREFELLKENDYTAEYKGPVYTLGSTDGNINVGGKYETYLVVISGPDGNIIDYRSGRSLGDEEVALIRTMTKETMFDRDGNVLGQIENPGEAFKAAVPAAVSSGREDY
jgi:hypothetical protein